MRRKAMAHSHWLLKTEPSTYSYEQLLKDKSTHWNGVRNFQARNFLQKMKRGDLALIYHSGDVRAVVGIAQITREGYADLDPKKPGEWCQVDLKALKALKKPVLLSEIKANPKLADLLLIKQSRLSVMPVTPQHYEILIRLGDSK